MHYNIVIIVLLILFVIYRRIRRNIGFQKLAPKRLRIRMIIFFIIGLMLLASSAVHPILYISDAVGILLGLILAYYAMKTTRFEARGEQWYYRPNGWIGGIVIAMFLGRLLYAFVMLNHTIGDLPQQSSGASTPIQSGSYVRSPWTAGVIFVLFSYYSGYFLFLLRKFNHLPDPSATNEAHEDKNETL